MYAPVTSRTRASLDGRARELRALADVQRLQAVLDLVAVRHDVEVVGYQRDCSRLVAMRRPPITFGVITRSAPERRILLSEASEDERATM